MEPIELLKTARKLIPQYEWCQGALARDEDGSYTTLSSGRATQFCTLGFLCKANIDDGWSETYGKARAVLNNIVGGSISIWNDYEATSKQDVIDLYDKAIAEAEAK